MSRSLAAALVSLFLCAAATAGPTDNIPVIRIKELPHHLQNVVTVVGRTGYIAEQYEKNGLHAFTLRDDYNDQVFVRTPSKNYPIMGVTYRVVGWANRSQNGTLFLDTLAGGFTPVYPLPGTPTVIEAAPAVSAPAVPTPGPSSQFLTWLPALTTLLAAAVIVVISLRRWQGRSRPEWGELLVTGGPDRGVAVPLRRSRVALGRGVNPARDIRFTSGDQTVSNLHAVISYRGGALYVCDMNSSNGTRIGGEKLGPGQPTRVNSGDLIHLGTRGTVVIVRLHSTAPASGLLGRLREPAPLGEKTLMVPDAPAEEPAWMRGAAEAPEAAPPATTVEVTPAAEGVTSQPSLPAPLGIQEREAEADDEEEEDSIPHTHLSPMVFSFAGHSPRGSRRQGDAGHELVHDPDEETASA